MIGISFGIWSRAAGPKYVKERILLSGYRLFGVYGWTPFVRYQMRCEPQGVIVYLDKGLTYTRAREACIDLFNDWGKAWPPEPNIFEYDENTGAAFISGDLEIEPVPPADERHD